MQWQGRKVLVTGGGSGIGREIVRALHARGADVIVASLLQAELDALQREMPEGPGRLFLLQSDLTAPDAVSVLMETIEQQGLDIEVLVNNAGTALFGEQLALDPQRVRSMLTLNILAMTELATAVAAHMTIRDIRGCILNVASIGAFVPVPHLAAYSASKHYVLAFTQAIAEELAPHGIHVGALCPGITRTPIFEAMGLERNNRSVGSISNISEKFSMDASAVAQCAVRAIEQKTRVALPGLNRIVPLAGKLPGWVTAKVMASVVNGRHAK